ncbi:MAG: hypothetical protein R3327_04165 [Nitrosopumilaceae archaeon]|nr:hypothetical protein [Nitrosopumilaceae archaeon]
MRKGIKSYLPEEATQRSITNSFLRKNTRLRFKKWVGLPKFAFAQYEKVSRFTFYLKYDHLLLISVETDIDINKIIITVKNLIKTYAE